MAFIQKIASSLVCGNSIALSEFENTPWTDTLRETANNEYNAQGGNKVFSSIDAQKIDHPDRYLISLMPDSFGYRPTQEVSAFIRSRSAFKDRVFWVTGIPLHTKEIWCSLCKELSGNVQFVLAFDDVGKKVSGADHILYYEWVKDFDVSIFGLTVAYSRKDCVNVNICKYIAELANQRFGKDVVSTLDFVSHFSANDDPLHYGCASQEVWRAQIRTTYHIVEEERCNFIENYRIEIASQLPQQQFGEIITDPEQVEFGLLWSLRKNLFLQRRLSENDYELLEFLRSARNSLSHGSPLSPVDIYRLLVL